MQAIGGLLSCACDLLGGNTKVTAVLGGGNAHRLLELPHEMNVAFVSAGLCHFTNAVGSARQEVFSLLDAAIDDIGHGADAEGAFI